MQTYTIQRGEADIVYDVEGPLPTAGDPPLLMIGQPMVASGFRTLASYFPDRTVITYDPRGLGRSIRRDGRVDNVPNVQADDVHAVIATLGAGPVELFASSGGAITALALVAVYPTDVSVLVAHEPPLVSVLPDAEAAGRAMAQFRDAYAANGSGAGMAAFIAMTSWRGPFTEDYFSRPAPDPAQFGMPAVDDGSRDDPLLSDRSSAVTSYCPDFEALIAAPTRIVIALGEEFGGNLHGTRFGGDGRTAGSEADSLPQSSRRVRGRRLRIRRQARSFCPHASKRPHRVLSARVPVDSRLHGTHPRCWDHLNRCDSQASCARLCSIASVPPVCSRIRLARCTSSAEPCTTTSDLPALRYSLYLGMCFFDTK